MDEFDDSQSFQILEPDIDQQYVPEKSKRNVEHNDAKKSPDKQRSAAPRNKQSVTPDVRQRAPVLIVERQVAPAEPKPAATAEKSKQQPLSARIVDVANDSVARRAAEQNSNWLQASSRLIIVLIQFFSMSVAVFVALVLINPPFVQDNTSAFFGSATGPVRRPASMRKAAVIAGFAGISFLAAPYIWSVVTSRFFPHDMLLATGLRQPPPTRSRKRY